MAARRAHGEGSVYKRTKKRKDGSESVAWAYLLPPNLVAPGERGYRGGFKTSRAARDALRAAIGAAEQGTYVKRTTDTVEGYADAVFLPKERSQRRQSTAAMYEQQLRTHVLPHIGGMRLQSVTPVHLQRLWTGMLEGAHGRRPLKPRTVRMVYGVVRKLFADAEGQHLVTRNPATGSNPPSGASTEPPELDIWTAEQLEAFLAHAREQEHADDAALDTTRACRTCASELPLDMFPREPLGRDGRKADCRRCYASKRAARGPEDRQRRDAPPRYTDDGLWPLFVLAARTGMRRGELCGLRWSDVDLDDGLVHVRQQLVKDGHGGWAFNKPKTQRSRRMVPLDGDTRDVLRAHRARQVRRRLALGSLYETDADLVFARADGKAIGPDQVLRRFKDLAAGAGLPRIKFHGLRHSVATIASEVDLAGASMLLGHHDPAFTARRYVHPDVDRIRRLVGGRTE